MISKSDSLPMTRSSSVAPGDTELLRRYSAAWPSHGPWQLRARSLLVTIMIMMMLPAAARPGRGGLRDRDYDSDGH